jgi:gamma-glutamylcyclotransferase (GGCT)/AIG2-like uncharacterized protein YtfP
VSDFLFSYGTLLPQHAPEDIAATTAKLRPYAEAWVYGTLYDLGDFPGVRLQPDNGSRVFGTVFLLPDDPDLLQRLDEYEGFNPDEEQASLFIRRRQTVTLTDGNVLECWIYEYNGTPSSAQIIASGKYHPGL